MDSAYAPKRDRNVAIPNYKVVPEGIDDDDDDTESFQF
jgi:hypothetical protein